MFKFFRLVALLLVALVVVPLRAAADPAPVATPKASPPAPFMRVYGPSLPPFGYVRFCAAFPAECRRGDIEENRMAANAARMAELDRINREINKAIAPATDMEVYGEIERWTLPVSRGDCEDYALMKRKTLIRMGWPPGALLITVVRDEKGEGHAILTARTSKGDFILDNKNDELKLWSATPYKYVMRQSYIDPNVWLSLDPAAVVQPAMLGGTREGP
jgi:predicted transglutaminase-like cysteine proteinase